MDDRERRMVAFLLQISRSLTAERSMDLEDIVESRIGSHCRGDGKQQGVDHSMTRTENMDTRNVYFVIEDGVRIVHKKAGTAARDSGYY